MFVHDGGGISQQDTKLLTDTLKGLNYDPEEIESLLLSLQLSENVWDNSVVAQFNEGWFGGSSTGGYRLATNATMAHDALTDEVAKLVSGLREYRTEIQTWAKEVETADQTAATSGVNLTNATSCVTDLPQCTVVPSGEDD